MKIEIDKQLAVLKPEKKEIVLHAFGPIVQDLNDLGKEYPTIQKMEQSPERSARAKRFRIDFKRAVNKADSKRKDLKDESLQEGRAIQNVFNYIKEVTAGTLEEVICIEQYYENLEKAEQEKLRKERLIELEKYEMDGTALSLGEMDTAIWENFLLGARRGFEERQREEKEEAGRLAEQQRIDDLDLARNKETVKYFHVMSNTQTDIHLGDLSDQVYTDLLHTLKNQLDHYNNQQEKIKEDNEILRAENEKAETKRIADKKRSDNKLKKEREDKKKLEDQIAEDNRLKEEKANAPDKAKLLMLMDEISATGILLKNKLATEMLTEIVYQIKSFVDVM